MYESSGANLTAHIYDLAHDCSNPSALAMELL